MVVSGYALDNTLGRTGERLWDILGLLIRIKDDPVYLHFRYVLRLHLCAASRLIDRALYVHGRNGGIPTKGGDHALAGGTRAGTVNDHSSVGKTLRECDFL